MIVHSGCRPIGAALLCIFIILSFLSNSYSAPVLRSFRSMRRFPSARLPVLNAARPPQKPPLSRLYSYCPSSSSSPTTLPSTTASTASSTTRLPLVRPSPPLSQTAKRFCSYRRMCGSRRADGVPGGSTNVIAHGREVLPTNVKPVHYDLTLEPDFEKFTYDGSVVIEYVILFLLTWGIGVCGDYSLRGGANCCPLPVCRSLKIRLRFR